MFQKPRWQSMNLKMHCSDRKKNETWPVDLDSAIENLWQTKCDLIPSKLRFLNSVAGLYPIHLIENVKKAWRTTNITFL